MFMLGGGGDVEGLPDLLLLGVWEGLHECLDWREGHVQPIHMVLAEGRHAHLRSARVVDT